MAIERNPLKQYVLQMCLSPTDSASSHDNKITSLPGQPAVKFSQYSGYVTVDDTEKRSLFYYFVEAENHPESKPLVLWLNGGPGCSSVSAAFYGHGPFMLKRDFLIRNNFTWSQAQDNLRFLFRWLERFPEYKNRDLFISGVSYAGHFVAQLANLILYTSLKSNFKGIVIGNPLLDFDTDRNAQGDFLWSHGLISDSTYSMLNMVCNVSQIYRQSMEGNISPACLQGFFFINNQAIEEIGSFVETDDVLSDKCLSESSSQVKEGVDVCLLFQVVKYFNRKDVQQAFHAKLVGVNQWSHCISDRTNNTHFDSDIRYKYDPKDQFVSMIPLLGNLAREGIRIMIFSKASDVCNMQWRSRCDYTISGDKKLDKGSSRTVGGWTQVYGDQILSFATVRGGGHDSAFGQPKRTLVLFNTFLQGKPLTN
ncbi:hypothetical protein V2J09_024013 [Rumex salicifolius]